jgi:serine/threonine protein kinase
MKNNDARGGAQVETMLQTGTTGLAMMIGTPHFMSPEQFALGVKVTPQTDLWSLAVTMYQALSGGLPFAAGEADRNRIGYAIVNTPSPRLTDAAGCAVPESLSDCVAKAMQKDLTQRYHTAADMATALRLATELPSRWAAMDGAANCTRVPILREADADLWSRVEARIAESLPDFALARVERVQNKALWRKYSTYCAGQEVVDERELFHYAKPDVVEKILNSSSVSFDPRLGGGEYGAGAYFAQHAVYSVAYGSGWLSGGVEQERHPRGNEVTLLLAKVSLGHCKDFGARCRTHRGNAAAEAADLICE